MAFRFPAGFRARLVLAATLLTLATLGGAFAVVYASVNFAQQRRLDRALRVQARQEAAEIEREGAPFVISARPGPTLDGVGPLPKLGALFEGGRVLVATAGFEGTARALARKPSGAGRAFDFWHGREHLRAVTVGVGGHPARTLLLAVPRADLDGDAAFLFRAMSIVFLVAVLWTVMVALVIVGRLTRVHHRIARVVRSVASGNLSLRVAPGRAPDELTEMGREVDDLIDRLSVLVQSQQQFIANAAHELRSPLTTLYGELSLALRRPRGADEYRRIIEEALESARRLKLLAEDLLALARAGTRAAGEPTDLAVTDVLVEALSHVQTEVARKRLTVRLPDDSPRVRGRGADVVRVFRNLFENAVRHAPAEGTIVVTVRSAGEAVAIAVADDGPGVDPHERERVFDPFYRGVEERASDHPGAGLGLTIVRQLAALNGGRVDLEEATEEGGACFVVTLPRAEDDQRASVEPDSRRHRNV
jgi:two-component system heavy metal sensor histidine kinase CusS